jgi:hypothetical protein
MLFLAITRVYKWQKVMNKHIPVMEPTDTSNILLVCSLLEFYLTGLQVAVSSCK